MSKRAGLGTLCLGLVVAGCSPPQPDTLVCLLDCSRSSDGVRPQAIKTIKELVSSLDPNLDRVAIFRMSQNVYLLYQGPPDTRSLMEVLLHYSGPSNEEYGTAYGKALLVGLEEAKKAQSKGFLVTVVVLGDGADEPLRAGEGNISWKTLPDRFQRFPDPGRLAFLFTEPKWGEQYRVGLGPVLGDRLLIFPPEMSTRKGPRQIRAFLRR